MSGIKFIDLHLHLDGAITVDIAKKLAALQGITLPCADDEELRKHLEVSDECTSLNDFLGCFELPYTLLQTRESLCEAAYLVCENLKAQGVIYAELRFAPQIHTRLSLSQEDAVLAALDGLKKSDLKANLILCCLRGDDNEAENLETLRLTRKYLVEDGGVVAIDLAGAEALFPTESYRPLFDKIRELGIPFTIHAGEAAGAGSVAQALAFGAKRIGHGVRSFEDPAVLRQLRENGVFLEMCPTSNLKTHALEDMSRYPLTDYLKAGIRVTLNTDDPAVVNTNMAKEFLYMKELLGLTDEQEKIIVGNSIDAAFTSEAVKAALRYELGQKEK